MFLIKYQKKYYQRNKEKICKRLKLNDYSNQNRCKNCDKLISNRAIRCRSCEYYIRRILRKNEGNPNWKGDNVGREALHRWVKVRKPKPELCEECKEKSPYDLANISGKYKRNVNDFNWLCRSCHMKSDGRLECITY